VAAFFTTALLASAVMGWLVERLGAHRGRRLAVAAIAVTFGWRGVFTGSPAP